MRAHATIYVCVCTERLVHLFRCNGALTPADTDRAENDPGLRRALALYRLDMRTEAQREWNWSLRGQDDGFLLAASMLALRHEIFDRAINTAERTDPRANFELRFLTPYRQIIEPQVLLRVEPRTFKGDLGESAKRV